MSTHPEAAASPSTVAHDIVVIGGSAGAVDGITSLVRHLPADLPASLFVAIHISPSATSALPRILTRAGRLPAEHAVDGQKIDPGRIYVAPPDRHLLVDLGRVRLVNGPRENGMRPAIDPLFRSAAQVYGPRVIGVLLSGVLDDGTAGLVAVQKRGGLVIVQDPASALFTGMLDSALATVAVDHCVAPAEMPPLLARLTTGPPSPAPTAPATSAPEVQSLVALAQLDPAPLLGTPSLLVCPDCGGTLSELAGDMVRYRCHTGHAYSAESLLSRQTEGIEAALWASLRALEDKMRLCTTLAERARAQQQESRARRYDHQAQTVAGQCRLLRQLLARAGWTGD